MTQIWTWTNGETAAMRGAQEAHMNDTAIIWRYTSAPDAYGNPQATYLQGATVACGLRYAGQAEVQAAGQVPMIDAVLRLAATVALDTRDQVEITYRHGALLASSLRFDVVGPVHLGPSGLQVNLVRVTR